ALRLCGRVYTVVGRGPCDVGRDAVARGKAKVEGAIGHVATHRVRDDVHAAVALRQPSDRVAQLDRVRVDRTERVIGPDVAAELHDVVAARLRNAVAECAEGRRVL